MIFHTPGRVD